MILAISRIPFYIQCRNANAQYSQNACKLSNRSSIQTSVETIARALNDAKEARRQILASLKAVDGEINKLHRELDELERKASTLEQDLTKDLDEKTNVTTYVDSAKHGGAKTESAEKAEFRDDFIETVSEENKDSVTSVYDTTDTGLKCGTVLGEKKLNRKKQLEERCKAYSPARYKLDMSFAQFLAIKQKLRYR